MNETKVVHCKKDNYDIYIGRGSIYGNPFTHIKNKKTKAEFIVSTRADAITAYKNWVLTQPQIINNLEFLRGKRLGCFCAPKSCHGDILIELLNKKKYYSLF